MTDDERRAYNIAYKSKKGLVGDDQRDWDDIEWLQREKKTRPELAKAAERGRRDAMREVNPFLFDDDE